MQGNILGMAPFMRQGAAPVRPRASAVGTAGSVNRPMPRTEGGFTPAPAPQGGRSAPPTDMFKLRSRQIREQLRALILDTTDPMHIEDAKRAYMAEMRKLIMSQPQPDLGIFSRR